MAFIDTIAPSAASGELREMYQRQQASWGFVPNYAKIFCHRPEVLARWARLLAELRRPMDDRRFELATFVAAYARRNTACALEHGAQLARFVGDEVVLGLARGETLEPLDAAEAAIAAYARKVATDAASVTAQDIAELKSHGLDDAEIFDIAAAVAGRAFFTTLLDALGVQADSAARDREARFGHALSVGRPLSGEPAEYLDLA